MYWNSITFERFIVLISFIFPSYVYMKEFDESMESTHFISVHKTIRRRIFFYSNSEDASAASPPKKKEK